MSSNKKKEAMSKLAKGTVRKPAKKETKKKALGLEDFGGAALHGQKIKLLLNYKTVRNVIRPLGANILDVEADISDYEEDDYPCPCYDDDSICEDGCGNAPARFESLDYCQRTGDRTDDHKHGRNSNYTITTSDFSSTNDQKSLHNGKREFTSNEQLKITFSKKDGIKIHVDGKVTARSIINLEVGGSYTFYVDQAPRNGNYEHYFMFTDGKGGHGAKPFPGTPEPVANGYFRVTITPEMAGGLFYQSSTVEGMGGRIKVTNPK